MLATSRLMSPSALVGFAACGHRTELERASAAGLITRPHYPNSALNALIERGRRHERMFLEKVRREGRSIIEIAASDFSADDRVEQASHQTEIAMRAGSDVIYQATFFDGAWVGHADFLIRCDSPSLLGSWSYEPLDTKLSREAKAGALLQLCAYASMVERVQGLAPERIHLVLGHADQPVNSYRAASLAPYYRRLRCRLLSHLERATPPRVPVDDPYPDPVEHCSVCDWASTCESRWRADDALVLIAGISRNQRRALTDRGVRTLDAFSRTSLPFAPALPHTSPASVARVREQARVQREGRERQECIYELIQDAQHGMGLEALPEPSSRDLFFDIEGDPFVDSGGREYLFGLVSLAPVSSLTQDAHYTALWAFDAAAERVQFEALIDRFKEARRADATMHIFHFAPYEPSTLKRLAARLATRVDELDELLRANVFVDLFRVVRQSLRASVESYSIKRLESLFGFKREMDLRAAGDARSALELWLELGDSERLANHDEICEQVRLYNRDDCLSAWKLRDWLEEKRLELGHLRGAGLPRPAQVAPFTPKAEVTQARVAREALKVRLLSGLPEANRTPEQQAKWLTAHLIEWHWREEKSTWWDFFRMCDLSDEELVEDAKPISGIRYVGAVGDVARSTVHRYSFPAQEHALEADDQCHERTSDSSYKIHALDESAHTLDVTRKKSSPAPAIQSLIPKDTIPTAAQRDALMALAQSVAEHAAQATQEHRLALDLLLRVPPPGVAGVDGRPSLLLEGEAPTAAAIRVVLELARSTRGGVLPIQGPPGSGKTHTGAQMILALVAARFRVGVTANSHKVIGNLLTKTCSLARAASRSLSILQRANEHQRVDDAFVAACEKNAEVHASLAGDRSVTVFSGTSWLWADCPPHSVDVLFVDEAGQMSLANVVSMAHAARVLVLLGDPMQLDQPRKGVHPPGSEVSALEHVLGGSVTMPPDRGLFLDKTWRLNPSLCRFTSETFYEGRLNPRPGSEQQRVNSDGPLRGAGIAFWPVDHCGNQNESSEEVDAVKTIFEHLLGSRWVNATGDERPITLADIVVVAPYNAHVRALAEALPAGARVGTVDKFQGQEAPVAIYTMASSTAEDAPRGMEFLYSLNRLNVAMSRARCMAILVASPSLLNPSCRSPRQMAQVSALCAAVEFSELRERDTGTYAVSTLAVT